MNMKRRELLGGMVAAPALVSAPALAAKDRGEFARAEIGELPVGWDYERKPVPPHALMVIDADTGQEITRVRVVNAATGVLSRDRDDGRLDADGWPEEEIIHGRFRIERRG